MANVLFIGGFKPAIGSTVKKECKCTIIDIKNPVEAIEFVNNEPEKIDSVLMSLNMPEMNGLDAMDRVHAADSDLPVIISTHNTEVSTIVDAMKRGAFNYIYEPNAAQELPFILDRSLEYMKTIRENRKLQKSLNIPHEFIGMSAASVKIKEIISKAAGSPLPVLITGESGTGKEIAARALHRLSSRADEHFIAVNCSALSPTLLEAELFGYVKGAFTGADRNHKGLFEQADKGTLFLDEIGTTEPSFQVTLLRAIEAGEIRRVGDEDARKVDVRIIAASNSSLENGIKEGTFRKDLFYRLNVIPLTIPPLRKRREDITVLARFFLSQIQNIQPDTPGNFSSQALAALERYDWPGNGRELRNVIERASLMCTSDAIQISDLPEHISSRAGIDRVSREHGLKKAAEQFESSFITRVLEETEGNKAETARRLGLNRTTLV